MNKILKHEKYAKSFKIPPEYLKNRTENISDRYKGLGRPKKTDYMTGEEYIKSIASALAKAQRYAFKKMYGAVFYE